MLCEAIAKNSVLLSLEVGTIYRDSRPGERTPPEFIKLHDAVQEQGRILYFNVLGDTILRSRSLLANREQHVAYQLR